MQRVSVCVQISGLRVFVCRQISGPIPSGESSWHLFALCPASLCGLPVFRSEEGVLGGGASRGAYEKTREVCMGKGAWVDVQDGGVREAVRTVNALRLHVLIDVQGYGVCNAHATMSRCTSV